MIEEVSKFIFLYGDDTESIWSDSDHVTCLLLDICTKSKWVSVRLFSDPITIHSFCECLLHCLLVVLNEGQPSE